MRCRRWWLARAGLGTINHTLLTLDALRAAKVEIAGVVINRYPAESASAAEETNPDAIERWGGVRVLAIVPEEVWIKPEVPAGVRAAIDRVDWMALAGG